MTDTHFTYSSEYVTADRRFEFASLLQARGELRSAADLARQALDIAPDWAAGWFALGEMLMADGQGDAAGNAFAHYLDLDPGDVMGAGVKRSLLGLEPMPQTLPDAYVKSLFDQYAADFDAALVERLHYRAPQLLRALVDEIKPRRGRTEIILDLGCGTGLSGEAFRDRARRIEGVDLSAAMLDEARKKAFYNSLLEAEIRRFLNGCAKRYDLVLAVDVLIYMGALEDVFAGVRPILAPGGLFCFTVQSVDGDGFELGPDHRYSYSETYLTDCADQTGCEAVAIRSCVLRQDEGRDVPGLLCIFRA
jgi:predicted TPR repeat methyltransferase